MADGWALRSGAGSGAAIDVRSWFVLPIGGVILLHDEISRLSCAGEIIE
jgi:hypothetical protein